MSAQAHNTNETAQMRAIARIHREFDRLHSGSFTRETASNLNELYRELISITDKATAGNLWTEWEMNRPQRNGIISDIIGGTAGGAGYAIASHLVSAKLAESKKRKPEVVVVQGNPRGASMRSYDVEGTHKRDSNYNWYPANVFEGRNAREAIAQARILLRQRGENPRNWKLRAFLNNPEPQHNSYKRTPSTPLHVHDYERTSESGTEHEVTDYYRGKRGKGAHPKTYPTPRENGFFTHESTSKAQRVRKLGTTAGRGMSVETPKGAGVILQSFQDMNDGGALWYEVEGKGGKRYAIAARDVRYNGVIDTLGNLGRAVSGINAGFDLKDRLTKKHRNGTDEKLARAEALYQRYAQAYIDAQNESNEASETPRERRAKAQMLRALAIRNRLSAKAWLDRDEQHTRSAARNPKHTPAAINKLSRTFHGNANAAHMGHTAQAVVSNHVKGEQAARLGGLAYLKLLNPLPGMHRRATCANVKHHCKNDSIIFNPATSKLGMTTGRKLVLMGAGVHAAGKRILHAITRHNPAFAGNVVDLGEVEVTGYLTEEKHSPSGAMILYYHPQAEESGRRSDMPHVYLDEEGMLFIPQTGAHAGGYSMDERGIIN